LVRLLLCRNPLKASTNICVAATTVFRLTLSVPTRLTIARSSIEAAESNFPRPDISTLVELVSTGVIREKTTRCELVVAKMLCRLDDDVTGEIFMTLSRDANPDCGYLSKPDVNCRLFDSIPSLT
jgi:hypothetical protein